MHCNLLTVKTLTLYFLLLVLLLKQKSTSFFKLKVFEFLNCLKCSNVMTMSSTKLSSRISRKCCKRILFTFVLNEVLTVSGYKIL